MRNQRFNKNVRQSHILKAAAELAYEQGYKQISQMDIARLAGVAPSTITYHFCDMGGLRRDLMEWAVKNNDLRILAQGLSMDDPIALAAPETARVNASASLNNA